MTNLYIGYIFLWLLLFIAVPYYIGLLINIKLKLDYKNFDEIWSLGFMHVILWGGVGGAAYCIPQIIFFYNY